MSILIPPKSTAMICHFPLFLKHSTIVPHDSVLTCSFASNLSLFEPHWDVIWNIMRNDIEICDEAEMKYDLSFNGAFMLSAAKLMGQGNTRKVHSPCAARQLR